MIADGTLHCVAWDDPVKLNWMTDVILAKHNSILPMQGGENALPVTIRDPEKALSVDFGACGARFENRPN